MFGFSLDTGKYPEIITLIDEVKNIEGPHPITYKKVRLINVENIPGFIFAIENSSRKYENNGYIHILDQQRTIVSGTFISNLKVVKSKNNNVTVSGNVWNQPQGYQKAWDMKLNNKITEKNIWKTFGKDELQGWLVYALHTCKPGSERKNIKVEIDGNNFHNLDGFFCTLGEDINGIAGYFGRNLPALYDCLGGDFGVKSISELIWTNHKRSKKILKKKFTDIIKIFDHFDTKVSLK